MLAGSLSLEDEEAVQAELQQLQLQTVCRMSITRVLVLIILQLEVSDERPIDLPSVPTEEPATPATGKILCETLLAFANIYYFQCPNQSLEPKRRSASRSLHDLEYRMDGNLSCTLLYKRDILWCPLPALKVAKPDATLFLALFWWCGDRRRSCRRLQRPFGIGIQVEVLPDTAAYSCIRILLADLHAEPVDVVFRLLFRLLRARLVCLRFAFALPLFTLLVFLKRILIAVKREQGQHVAQTSHGRGQGRT